VPAECSPSPSVPFVGFEATAIYREEARNPDRTVPHATYIAVGFLGLFYAFISWIIIQAFGNLGAVDAATTTRPAYSSPPWTPT
jgi:amino acid transporter